MSDSKLITSIPDIIDLKERWLVEHWSQSLGVSTGRLRQCVRLVGSSVPKIAKFLKGGHRIAIEDRTGIVRLVGRITMLPDGFSIQVPYHPAKEGWLLKTTIDYRKRSSTAPITEQFSVSDTVKLSLHMSGFVHFSTAGQQPITSGYCDVLKKPKGLGLKAPDKISVFSGPLCGFVVQGLEQFKPLRNELAEIFRRNDLWFHPDYPSDSTAYHVEIFMLPLSRAAGAQDVGEKRIVAMQLPFAARFRFQHTLRIVELPGLWFALGVIVSPCYQDTTIDSGYKLASPGFGEEGNLKSSITAWYPRPKIVENEKMPSLDYVPPETASAPDA
jgi:hypothetical protein